CDRDTGLFQTYVVGRERHVGHLVVCASGCDQRTEECDVGEKGTRVPAANHVDSGREAEKESRRSQQPDQGDMNPTAGGAVPGQTDSQSGCQGRDQGRYSSLEFEHWMVTIRGIAFAAEGGVVQQHVSFRPGFLWTDLAPRGRV
ncbi:MAG: hypothetical protein KAW67_03295, partial [Candidatus Eisenbacteria sp.]|nr:hypothetical protein [Candidatus Eisenbacteria bacterium]